MTTSVIQAQLTPAGLLIPRAALLTGRTRTLRSSVTDDASSSSRSQSGARA